MSTNGKTLKFRAAKLKGFTVIISGSYGGHRRHTTYDPHQTTPWVWHKLPTGELKNRLFHCVPCIII